MSTEDSTIRFVLVKRFCALTGHDEDQVHDRFRSGEWRFGSVKAGRLHIDMESYKAWKEDPINYRPPDSPAADRHYARATKAANHSGVYLLFDGRRLVYIGMATNIQKRLGDHASGVRGNPMAKWNRYATVACPPDKLRETEARLIADLGPIYNAIIE